MPPALTLSPVAALHAQRYKKFDQASYATQNATFYNVFAADAVRVGRYKVPVGDSALVLCVTDPLTFSELRRYLNSVHALKWLHNKGMQQKRKRQYVLPMDSGGRISGSTGTTTASSSSRSSAGESGGDTIESGLGFYRDAVQLLEWGRVLNNDQQGGRAAAGRASVTVPIVPPTIDASTAVNMAAGVAGLVVPMATANSQYFLEALVQAVLSYLVGDGSDAGVSALPDATSRRPRRRRTRIVRGGGASSLSLLVGGDGRTLTPMAVEAAVRVGAGNGVAAVVVAQDGLLTTGAAVAVLRARLTSGSDLATQPQPSKGGAGDDTVVDEPVTVTVTDAALVFTAGGAAAGLRGSFGVRAVVKETHLVAGARGASCVRVLDGQDWAAIVATTHRTRTAHIVPVRPALALALDTLSKAPMPYGPAPTATRVAGATRAHAAALAATFDLPALQAYLAGPNGPYVAFDCACAPAATRFLTQGVIKPLGLDATTCLLNATPASAVAAASAGVGTDFDGRRPAADLTACPEAAGLFGLPEAVRDPSQAAEQLQRWADRYYQETRRSAGGALGLLSSMTSAGAGDGAGGGDGVGGDGGGAGAGGATPDIGFVFDADAGRCLVLAPRLAVTPMEQRRLFDAAAARGWLSPAQVPRVCLRIWLLKVVCSFTSLVCCLSSTHRVVRTRRRKTMTSRKRKRKRRKTGHALHSSG